MSLRLGSDGHRFTPVPVSVSHLLPGKLSQPYVFENDQLACPVLGDMKSVSIEPKWNLFPYLLLIYIYYLINIYK